MTLRTAFTDLFSVEHPIALAPMGGYAPADLVGDLAAEAAATLARLRS